MGACTSSKQESSGGNIGKAKFEKTKCPSVDKLFKQAQDINDNFTKSIDIIEKNKALFLKLSKMELEPSKKLGIGVTGMLLFFASSVEDPSKLKHQTSDRAPFFDITVPKDVKDGDKMWTAFQKYAQELDDVVREKLPKMLDELKQVADQADTVQDRAADEIERLGMMDKGKAGINIPKNVSTLKDQS
jgi:hypothetical protein